MQSNISDHTIAEIRSRCDIVDVISSRIKLIRAGSLFKACCPFHNEKTPSFIVNPQWQTYKCFGCGKSGDVFSFLMEHDGLSFVDAVRTLADRCGLEINWGMDSERRDQNNRLLSLHSEIAAFFQNCLLTSPEAEHARKYLASRSLDGDISEKFGIGYAPQNLTDIENFANEHKFTAEEMCTAGILVEPDDADHSGKRYISRFRGRLMFPICDTRGRVIAFSGRILNASQSHAKYVNSPETPIFTKSRVLYALDKAQRGIVSSPNREAIVCEGQIDVIRCHACGFPRAVASQGTAFTEDHAALLKRYADSAVLLFDQDPAGQKAAVRAAEILVAAGIPVRIASLPKGDDPDSFLRKHTQQDFSDILAAAPGVTDFAVSYFRSKEPKPDSEGAVGRIADGVLNIAARCGNPVHKAKMVQETSKMLAIPEQALYERLTAIENKAAARRTFNKGPQQYQSGGAFVPRKNPPGTPDFAEIAKQAENDAAITSKENKLYMDICAILVHNADNVENLLPFMAQYLPAEIIDNPIFASIFSSFYEGGTDQLLKIQTNDPKIAEILGKVAVSPDKVSAREAFTIHEIARELVMSAWKRRLETIKASIPPDSPGMQRIDLIVDIKQLSSWNTGEAVIKKYLENPAKYKIPKPESDDNTHDASKN